MALSKIDYKLYSRYSLLLCQSFSMLNIEKFSVTPMYYGLRDNLNNFNFYYANYYEFIKSLNINFYLSTLKFDDDKLFQKGAIFENFLEYICLLWLLR